MQYYKKDKAGKLWQRNPFVAILFLIRDFMVFLLPIRRLSAFAVNLLYGVRPKFIFFVHARRSEDIYIALPF